MLTPAEQRTEARSQIAEVLQRLTDEGGTHNFVIFQVDDCRYVQFATSCGSAVMYGEASSGRYCIPGCKCPPTPTERVRLLSLGWRPPTRRKFLNFYRYWPFITERDQRAIADTVVATLDVYGWRGESLQIQLHMD